MTVEIKELIVRARVDPDSQQGQQPDPDELIRACVEQVMRIIERKNHR